MRLYRFSALFLVGCCSIVPTTLVAQPRATLTRADIEQAVAWGWTGDPAPYLLHNFNFGNSPEVNPGVVAVVYTPFVRVALAAKAAQAEGRLLTPQDVPARLVEPVAYLAFRWYCCDRVHGDDPSSFNPFSEPYDYRIAVPGEPVLRGWAVRVMATPLWVKRDMSVLASFSPSVPYQDIVMLAAYPMDALVSGTDFVIYRIWSSPTQPGPYSEMRVGRITAADLAQWLSTGPGPRVHSVHTFRSYFPYSASLRSEEVQNTLDTLDTTFQEGFVGMVTMMVIGYSRPRTRRRNAASARRSA